MNEDPPPDWIGFAINHDEINTMNERLSFFVSKRVRDLPISAADRQTMPQLRSLGCAPLPNTAFRTKM